MVVDQTGSLDKIKRHDYLPFGEEVGAGIGERTTNQGYVADNVRQKFTKKERDTETGLDYFLARYYSSSQGRFTSPDEFTGGPDELYYFVDDAAANPTFYADLTKPQSLNKYQYAYNNPLRYVDPDGHEADDLDDCCQDARGVRIPMPPLPLRPLTQDERNTTIGGLGVIGQIIDDNIIVPIRNIPLVVMGRQLIGTEAEPTVAPVPIPQPGQQTQPMPPPPPMEARRSKGRENRGGKEHGRGKKHSKGSNDKHTRVDSGQKKPPNYDPFRKPPPRPKPPPKPPKPKREPKPEIGPDGQPIHPPD